MGRLIGKSHIRSSLLLIMLTAAAAHGTVYIPADTSIGTWDGVGRVFTLTADVGETVEVTEDNLTLDGAGRTIKGADSGYGIHLNLRTGVTITNVNVQDFTHGI